MYKQLSLFQQEGQTDTRPPVTKMWNLWHGYTCFSSDFFHEAADDWRQDAWNIMRQRSDCQFFMITKRPERVASCLPYDWEDGTPYAHVQIAVTCENQAMADKWLPVYLNLPIVHKSVMVEPMLEALDLKPYFDNYPEAIEEVSVGGESGPDARSCDFAWVQDLYEQCRQYKVTFHYENLARKPHPTR